MFVRFGVFGTTLVKNGQGQQQRGMATLKAISIRLKSVKNIQKITQSMKMVSAAKYARAERELKAVRPIGSGASQFYEKAEIQAVGDVPQKLLIAMTSDRGNFLRSIPTNNSIVVLIIPIFSYIMFTDAFLNFIFQ